MSGAELTSCEEYGHLYEPCDCDMFDIGCGLMICADCDDEYEED